MNGKLSAENVLPKHWNNKIFYSLVSYLQKKISNSFSGISIADDCANFSIENCNNSFENSRGLFCLIG